MSQRNVNHRHKFSVRVSTANAHVCTAYHHSQPRMMHFHTQLKPLAESTNEPCAIESRPGTAGHQQGSRRLRRPNDKEVLFEDPVSAGTKVSRFVKHVMMTRRARQVNPRKVAIPIDAENGGRRRRQTEQRHAEVVTVTAASADCNDVAEIRGNGGRALTVATPAVEGAIEVQRQPVRGSRSDGRDVRDSGPWNGSDRRLAHRGASPAKNTSYSALAFKSCRTNTRAPPRGKSEGSMQNAESWGRISLVLQTAPLACPFRRPPLDSAVLACGPAGLPRVPEPHARHRRH